MSMIGLTGGIGSGKSSVILKLCSETGFPYLSADTIASDILSCPGPSLHLLRQLIGSQFFFSDGTLDRISLRKNLFADVSLRKKVDALLHPIIFASLKAKAETIEEETERPVIAEIPLLYEAGWQAAFSKIVVVYASRLICVERLMERNGMSFVEAENAVTAQGGIEEKVMQADYVIDNSGSWFDTTLQIKRLGEIIIAKSA